MIQSVFSYGRVLARAFATSIQAENTRLSSSHLQHNSTNAHQNLHLLSAVAGFSKSLTSDTVPCSNSVQSKWNFGEDAYFITKYRADYVLGESVAERKSKRELQS